MAEIANGWTFQRGDSGSPEVFTAVPQTVRAQPGAPTAPDLDGTHLTSTARETSPGLPQFGDFTVETNYMPGNSIHNAIRAEVGNNVARNYRLMDPTNTFGFQYVLRVATFVSANIEVDGVLRNTITFKQAGQPTLIGAA